MKPLFAIFLTAIGCLCINAQKEVNVELGFISYDIALSNAISQYGSKFAFQQFLSDDAIIFMPDAVNGKEYWKKASESNEFTISRKFIFSENSSNNALAYTFGTWTRTRKHINDQFGQYVTIWAKRGDKYQAVLDITTRNAEEFDPPKGVLPSDLLPRDRNIRGWSAADSVMNFLKLGMTKEGLGEAYDKFAAPNVRLIKEDSRSITGKKAVVNEMKQYRSIEFPKKNWLIESADMAYSWNPCEYANSDEGMEKGNCLHVWRLNKEKWYIVLGVFARVRITKQPELKSRSR